MPKVLCMYGKYFDSFISFEKYDMCFHGGGGKRFRDGCVRTPALYSEHVYHLEVKMFFLETLMQYLDARFRR